MEFTRVAFIVILALLPVSDVLAGIFPTPSTTTTVPSTTTTVPSTTTTTAVAAAALPPSGSESRPCPDGVYDSATDSVTFPLTEAQCNVIIDLSPPKKGKKSKKGSKSGPSRKSKKGKQSETQAEGGPHEKGDGKSSGKYSSYVKVVSTATEAEGGAECPVAIIDRISKKGFIVDIGGCELIAIKREKKKGSSVSPSPIIYSRPKEG